VPPGDVAAALAAGVANAGGGPRSLVLEFDADGTGLAPRCAGARARKLEAAVATAVVERWHVPDLRLTRRDDLERHAQHATIDYSLP
jgi:hypothetical protein